MKQWALENPWLTFFLILIIFYFGALPARLLRTISIVCRGWPKTPNMDADGDIVQPESKV